MAFPPIMVRIGVLALEEVLANTMVMQHRLGKMPKALEQGGTGDTDEVKLRRITLLCLYHYRMTTPQPPEVIRHTVYKACPRIQASALFVQKQAWFTLKDHQIRVAHKRLSLSQGQIAVPGKHWGGQLIQGIHTEIDWMPKRKPHVTPETWLDPT